MFETSGKPRCPGEEDCEEYQGAVGSDCLMEYSGKLVNLGAYQACMNCEKLPTKPLVQLQRMAEVVPDPQLQKYRTDADVELLIDRIERLAEHHRAGWLVDFGSLEWWECDLVIFWLNAEKQMERIAVQAQQMMMQALLQALLKAR